MRPHMPTAAANETNPGVTARRRFAHVVGSSAASALALTTMVVTPAPAHAAFPGANGRIVFDTIWKYWDGVDASQIYSVRPDGGGLHQLTHMEPGSAAWHPAVSPSARRIAYVVSSGDANDQIWIMRSDGSHQRPVVAGNAWSNTSPSFTASGRRLLFTRCGTYVAIYWTCKIDSVRLDGSGRRTVIGGTWHPFDPAMSPDGSTIAYVSDAGGYDSRLWLADADGGHRRVVGPKRILMERPSWSPDGKRLVFTDGRFVKLYTMRVDGTGLHAIASNAIFGAWSPDGTRIVSLHAPDSGAGPLQVTRTDGHDPTGIVKGSRRAGYSDWGVRR
jgi:Tol biopolymer transport system component